MYRGFIPLLYILALCPPRLGPRARFGCQPLCLLGFKNNKLPFLGRQHEIKLTIMNVAATALKVTEALMHRKTPTI